MRTEDRKAVERLARAGIGFSVSMSVPGGAATISVTAKEAVAYLSNPQAFVADHHGLSEADYEMWVALDGQAMCGASRRSDRRPRRRPQSTATGSCPG
jgi:hypothetical protein